MDEEPPLNRNVNDPVEHPVKEEACIPVPAAMLSQAPKLTTAALPQALPAPHTDSRSARPARVDNHRIADQSDTAHDVAPERYPSHETDATLADNLDDGIEARSVVKVRDQFYRPVGNTEKYKLELALRKVRERIVRLSRDAAPLTERMTEMMGRIAAAGADLRRLCDQIEQLRAGWG